MNSVARLIVERLPFRWQRSIGSIRTQLIFWNIVALALLLCGLGITGRFVTLSVMMRSVDQELDRSIRMFMRRPREDMPPFREGGSPPPGPNGPPGEYGFMPGDWLPPEAGGRPPREGGPPPGDWRPPGEEGGPPDGRRRPPGPPGGPPWQDPDTPFFPHVFNSDGTTEIPNDTRPILDEEALRRALRGEVVRKIIMVDGEPVRLLSSSKPDLYGGVGAVQNAYPLKEVYRVLAVLDTVLLLLIPVGLLGAGWVGAALTNRVLKRVQRMTHAAGHISAEDFSARLPVSGNDEFAELAETFNGLLGRLDRAYQGQKRLLEQQRRFTADASHELKTPLTIIKGSAGLALSRETTDEKSRRTFGEIDTAATTMSQLVQDLLLLARSDSGQMGRDAMEMLVREILERAAAQASHNGGAPITLSIEPEELCITGNEGELTRLFRNLLDNGVRYTPATGQITVRARAAGDNVIIAVADTGTGIAPEHLPHLGERFYRVDEARARHDGGTGLGLSICKGIVNAHGGTMTIESAFGKGTTVTVCLPRPV